MACEQISGGISLGCYDNIGGIKKMYITSFENIASVTDSSPDGIIDAITMLGGTAFYEFEFNKNTSTYTENLTKSIENGSLFYLQTITLKLPKREVAKRNILKVLAADRVAVIVEDKNGLFWLLGETNGADLTEMPSESGTASGDFNGYTLTIVGEEPVPAKEVDSSVIPTVI